MRILIDLQGAQTESRRRGIGRQARSLAKAIIKSPRDHDVWVLLNAALEENYAELTDELAGLLPPSRVVTFRYVGAVAERDGGNLWRTQAAERLREATLARLQPDLVHVSSLFEGYVDDAVASIGHFRTASISAVTLHDLIPLVDPERYLAEEGPRRHWLRRAQFLKRADLLVAVSEASRREAVARLHVAEDRIAVISAGVDPQFRPGAVEAEDRRRLRDDFGLDRPFVLYVGAIDPRKNVGLIFRAFARLPDAIQSGHLVAFAGHLFDAEIASLRRGAAAEGVPPHLLRFCGQVSDQNLVALYRTCAAFVFPSRLEGFGLPALEAMACGAPLLAARAASLPEVVGNDAQLFDPDDPDDLARSLHAILTDQDFLKWARAWGLDRAAGFTWTRSAEKALDAFEAVYARSRQRAPPPSASGAKFAAPPRLAFVSPLPPDASGVATYSAALLRELGRFYDIDCVTPTGTCDDPWVVANFARRDIAFFERNAPSYDRIVYSIGNSHFHADMLGLLERYPGVVILHDFYLSDLIDWMSSTGLLPSEGFARELYRTHGTPALLEEKKAGRIAAIDRYACNGVVFRSALGVIVHSAYAREQAGRLFGPGVLDRLAALPHLKAVPVMVDRRAARARLGLGDSELVVCSFGVVTRRKCSREVVQAWQASEAGRQPGARLVLVGEISDGSYGDELRVLIRASGASRAIVMTGYVDDTAYRDHLAAADIAIQLRTTSRGETSGAILDCLAHGMPVISNAHGPAAEYPASVLRQLPDTFSVGELTAAIDELAADPARRRMLGEAGQAHVRSRHDPGRVGELFFGAIEGLSTRGADREERTLLDAVSGIAVGVQPVRSDLMSVAEAVATTRPGIGPPQLLYDVTVLAEHDARTGIQRVVRAMLRQLSSRQIGDYRLELVRIDGAVLRYARAFSALIFGVSSGLDDEICATGGGDLYLSIDWVPDRLPDLAPWLTEFRRRGGRVAIGVHDLLPLELPARFPEEIPKVTRRWFETCLRVADHLVCVSETVAEAVVGRGTEWIRPGYGPIAVDVVHNAANFEDSLPSSGRPADATRTVAALASRPTFLMVGTVEPRKGHIQVLDGFEQLWRDDLDVGLTIVGKKGWMMDAFRSRVGQHAEHGARLLWLQDVTDTYLRDIYAASTALIAASEGEGFGLPLIEAARLGIPLIVRDIPVFREVVEGHAFFFGGLQPHHVAHAIRQWMDLARRGIAPSPNGLRVKTWAESTDDLLDVLFAGKPTSRLIARKQ